MMTAMMLFVMMFAEGWNLRIAESAPPESSSQISQDAGAEPWSTQWWIREGVANLKARVGEFAEVLRTRRVGCPS
jgi:hypothetical protein